MHSQASARANGRRRESTRVRRHGADCLSVPALGHGYPRTAQQRKLQPLHLGGSSRAPAGGTFSRFPIEYDLGPSLAERWEQPAALTYIFYLRRGVKWHDGPEFTAK